MGAQLLFVIPGTFGGMDHLCRMAPGTTAELMRITGRVQGVGYRAATLRIASGLELVGRIRNLADGSVEVVVEGTTEAVEQLAQWCARGPVLARVERVERRTLPPTGLTDLRIER